MLIVLFHPLARRNDGGIADLLHFARVRVDRSTVRAKTACRQQAVENPTLPKMNWRILLLCVDCGAR